MANTIDQLTVLKGGSIGVFGSAENGVQWSILTADYLLQKICANSRYKQILCINLDRNFSENKVLSTVINSHAHKLHILKNSDIFSDDVFDSSLTLESVKSYLMQNQVSQNNPITVFVYSVSEIILNVGAAQTILFMKKLQNLVTELNGGKDISESNNNNSSISNGFVYVIHESLHSTQVISQLQSNVTTVVRVVPNRGTLSPEVAAEIQTIRKSPNSGKVVECMEMFAFRDGSLVPIHNAVKIDNNVVHLTNQAGGDSTDKQSSIDDVNKELINPMSKLLSNESTDSTSTAKASQVTSPNTQGPLLSRLITFDSTDPEFDNDSDPDADLDL